MATFGKPPPVGGTQNNWGAGPLTMVCRFELTENGTITQLSWYGAVHAGTTDIYGVIYSDNAGSPNALLWKSASSETIDTTPIWHNFAANYAASAGFYWLGITAAADVDFFYDVGAANQLQQRYVDTPDPFGIPDFSLAEEMSVYATYTTAVTQPLVTHVRVR